MVTSYQDVVCFQSVLAKCIEARTYFPPIETPIPSCGVLVGT